MSVGCWAFISVFSFLHWSKRMIPKVIAAQYEHGFTVRISFADGTQGDVDLTDELYGEV